MVETKYVTVDGSPRSWTHFCLKNKMTFWKCAESLNNIQLDSDTGTSGPISSTKEPLDKSWKRRCKKCILFWKLIHWCTVFFKDTVFWRWYHFLWPFFRHGLWIVPRKWQNCFQDCCLRPITLLNMMSKNDMKKKFDFFF